MKLGLKIHGVTITKRLDRRDVGTDRYEVRCMCGAVLIRSAATLTQGGLAIGRDEHFLGCQRCNETRARKKTADFAARVAADAQRRALAPKSPTPDDGGAA